MKPYYQDKWVTIYHGDCREILPQLDVKADLVLTDPPYLDGDQSDILPHLLNLNRNTVVTTGKLEAFNWIRRVKPVYEYVWISHTKSKGGSACLHIQFEPILVWQFPYPPLGGDLLDYSIGTVLNDNTLPLVNRHAWAKPNGLWLKLIKHWSKEGDVILDPFLGSGTTCYCAKKLNRYSIGIEIEEKYCEIAAKRCCQEVMELR